MSARLLMPFYTLLMMGWLPIAWGQAASTATLTLDDAITAAISNDPWLSGSHLREEALRDEAVASAALPDPTVSIKMANFPTDGFDRHQEPMTQVVVGIAQPFPRGESRELSRRQKDQLAAQEPFLRAERQAKVRERVTQLWLELYLAQESIRLIEQDRSLFEHLADVTRVGYSSALGGARQQDIIRAQLELTRLDDRLTVLQQQRESRQQQLSEWVGTLAYQHLAAPFWSAKRAELPHLMSVVDEIADWQQQLYSYLQRNPRLLAVDQQLAALESGVELARQAYRPAWAINAQYGHRGDDLHGNSRADLFSVGVSFDLPLFTEHRQDRTLSAAHNRLEALKTDRHLLVRQLMAAFKTALVQLQRLKERDHLYQQQLLPQMAEQAEAALVAYNNDAGDFAETVRARIAELNAKIEGLAIAVNYQQTVATLDYLMTAVAPSEERE